MQNKRLKLFLFSGLGLLILSLGVGVSFSISVRKQDAKIDAIAQEFLQNYPPTTTNNTAKTLNVLVSELGIRSVTGSDSTFSTPPDPVQSEAFQAIAQDLTAYITTQGQKTQGPLDPIPENLQTYLSQQQGTLTAIQSHLLNNQLPTWDFDTEELSNLSHAVPSFSGLSQLQQLLSLKAISDYQQQQSTEMNAAIEANLVIYQAIVQRPELISYLVSLVVTNHNMGIVRHLEGVSPELSNQFLATDLQQLGHERIQFDAWTQYKGIKKWAQESPDLAKDFGMIAALNHLPLQRSYLMLSNVDIAQRMNLSYQQLPELTVCSASPETMNAQLYFTAPWWNLIGQVSTPSFIRQWQKGGQTMLATELTHHVTTAKALAAEQGQWPDTLPNLTSQTCPNQQWVYTVSPAGEMSLSFSHEIPWLTAEAISVPPSRWLLPLTYQATLTD
ncbi:MAG: hypothetical protein ACFB16_12640 [Phormidesmis sp.]